MSERLRRDRFRPWLDSEQLLPGDDWRLKIEEAVAHCDVVVVCLSNNSVDKEGFVQRELRYALERSDEQPEGRTFIIPVRLGPCEVPRRLQQWQWVDYFAESGYERLVKALRERARQKR